VEAGGVDLAQPLSMPLRRSRKGVLRRPGARVPRAEAHRARILRIRAPLRAARAARGRPVPPIPNTPDILILSNVVPTAATDSRCRDLFPHRLFVSRDAGAGDDAVLDPGAARGRRHAVPRTVRRLRRSARRDEKRLKGSSACIITATATSRGDLAHRRLAADEEQKNSCAGQARRARHSGHGPHGALRGLRQLVRHRGHAGRRGTRLLDELKRQRHAREIPLPPDVRRR